MSPPPYSLGERGLGFYEHRIYAVIYCSHILALRKESRNEGANNEGLSNLTRRVELKGLNTCQHGRHPDSALHTTGDNEQCYTSPEWWGGCLDYVDQKMYLKRVGGSKWGQKSVGKFDIVH